jgi:hypothetical protein
MALSDRIKKDVSEKKKQKLENIEFFKEQILSTDALKEDYDSAIISIDTDLLSDITIVNNTLYDVRKAYQDRIDAGCRSDLFWRFVGLDTGTGDYSLIVTKLSIVGYGTTVSVVSASGTFTTYPDDTIEIPGVEGDNLHAIKYYDEPYSKDIGDTTIGSFIGVVGTASTILSIISESSEELITNFDVGNLIVCSKTGLFPSGSNKIVGFGSTVFTGITTTLMEEVVGIATTSINVATILLESATVGFATLPESDGSFVEFTVVTDPDTFDKTQTRFEYQVKFGKNPFSPQTIGIMDSDTIGIGTYIEYDNSSKPPNTQSWSPEYEGTEKNGEKIKKPKVGAGRIYNIVGFTSEPTYLGIAQTEGATITTNTLTSLYTLISPPGGCTAIENTLTSAISARDAAESALSSGLGDFQTKVDSSNALRTERNDYSIKIWGLRQTIGGESDRYDQYESLETYINGNEEAIDGTTTSL